MREEGVMTSGVVPGCRISGEPRSGPERLAVVAPATLQPLAEVALGDRASVTDAVEAAGRAGPDWSGSDVRARCAALRAVAADLRAEADGLARLVTQETGKRIAEARAEVNFSADFFDWYADLGHVLADEYRGYGQRRFVVRRKPVGVVAVLTPWNFPLSIPARKLAPALVAGCTAVFKPSDLTPLSGLRVAEIVERHVPAGVVNTVVGNADLGAALVANDGVRGISFTGSTRVGALIAAEAAPRFVRLVLELGGRAPFVVCEDADLDEALEALLVAKYRNNGASCIAANDIFVHERLYDEFTATFVERSTSLRLGDPADEATELGPVVSGAEKERLERLVGQARDAGLTVWQAESVPSEGRFFPPTVVAEPPEGGAPWDQEIFGPVAAIRRYRDEAELVARINQWPQGLGGYVCSADLDHAMRLAERLDIGVIGINNGAPNTVEVPFGGFKESGIGREGGVAGLEAFLEHQMLSILA